MKNYAPFAGMCLTIGLTFLGSFVASTQADERTLQAEGLFNAARDLMKQGKISEACPKFAASQRLDPGIGTLLNLALCHEKEGKTASAWSEFKEVMSEAKRLGSKYAKHEAMAKKGLANVEPILVKMSISMATEHRVDGLKIKRNGANVDLEMLGISLPVDPGEYTIEASAPGKKAWSHKVTVNTATNPQSVAIPALDDAPIPATTASSTAPTTTAQTPPSATSSAPITSSTPSTTASSTSSEDSDTGSGHRIAGWVTTGVGLVGLGAGLAFGGIAMSKWNAAKKDCPNNLCINDAAQTKAEDARTFATVSTIGVIAGGAVTAIGLVVLLSAPSKSTTKDTGMLRRNWLLTPSVARDGAGLWLSGRF